MTTKPRERGEPHATTTVLLNEDCREALTAMGDNSVDSIVTDPPYGISFMNKHWDYQIPSVEIWRECLRVLKPGGYALIACGTRTQHRMAVNIEDAGFEIRDVITWLYGSGFPKSHDVSKAIDKAAGAARKVVGPNLRPDGSFRKNTIKSEGISFQTGSNDKVLTSPTTDAAKQWAGWGTALKPACEFWTLARKPLSESTAAKNVLKYGTGGINVDGSRVLPDGKRPDICHECAKNRDDLSANSAGKKTGRAEAASSTNIADSSVVGRLSVAELTTLSAGSTKRDTCVSNTGTTKKKSTSTSLSTGKYWASQCLADTSSTISTKKSKTTDRKTCNSCGVVITSPITTSASPGGRFPANLILDEEAGALLDAQSGVSKSSAAQRNNSASPNMAMSGANLGHISFCHSDTGGASRFFYCAKASKSERNAGCETGGNNHPTVKPIVLMRYLCKLVTPPGGIVLDPFMGSGSTGVAAVAENFSFTGIDINEEYVQIARRRVQMTTKPSEGDV